MGTKLEADTQRYWRSLRSFNQMRLAPDGDPDEMEDKLVEIQTIATTDSPALRRACQRTLDVYSPTNVYMVDDAVESCEGPAVS